MGWISQEASYLTIVLFNDETNRRSDLSKNQLLINQVQTGTITVGALY